MRRVIQSGALLRDAMQSWYDHRVPRLSAALAFYTTFSLTPMLLIAIAISGYFFGEEAARGQIVRQIEGLVGSAGAEAIQTMIANSEHREQSWLATLLTIATLVFGATGVFAQLKDSLDTIWEVQPKPGLGLWEMVRTRLLSFAVVCGTGFLLLVSLLMTAALTSVTHWAGRYVPMHVWAAWFLDVGVSFLVIMLLFALIFKLLPDVTVHWGDVWIGAVVTAALFMFGKYLIGMYIGSATLTTTYGAAGSLVIVLLWSYYSAQILFFGAELIRAYARQFGSRIVPTEQGVRVTQADLNKQGMPPQAAVEHASAREAAAAEDSA